MKKSILLFLAIFITTYISIGYLVPGFRIKLAANPFTYFVEGMKHMILLKSFLSLIMGFIFFLLVKIGIKKTRKPMN